MQRVVVVHCLSIHFRYRPAAICGFGATLTVAGLTRLLAADEPLSTDMHPYLSELSMQLYADVFVPISIDWKWRLMLPFPCLPAIAARLLQDNEYR